MKIRLECGREERALDLDPDFEFVKLTYGILIGKIKYRDEFNEIAFYDIHKEDWFLTSEFIRITLSGDIDTPWSDIVIGD